MTIKMALRNFSREFLTQAALADAWVYQYLGTAYQYSLEIVPQPKQEPEAL